MSASCQWQSRGGCIIPCPEIFSSASRRLLHERLKKALFDSEAENLQRRQKRARPDTLRSPSIRKETPLGLMFVHITEDIYPGICLCAPLRYHATQPKKLSVQRSVGLGGIG